MSQLYIFVSMMASLAVSTEPVAELGFDDPGPEAAGAGHAQGTTRSAPCATEGHKPGESRPAGPVMANPAPGKTPAQRTKATRESVVWIHCWTPALISIRVTRDIGLRFTPGHYARLGIADSDGHAVCRPLSIASAPANPWLDFFCTLVPGGEFSTRLATLRAGHAVEVERASYGFLTVDSLARGTDLWLLASGTGLAPFLSILRDPGVWRAFDRLVVAHSVRRAAELAYAEELRRLAQEPPAAAHASLRYLPIVTREPGTSTLSERIPALLAGGHFEQAAGLTLDPARSRVMVCGNPGMTGDLRRLLGQRGFRPSRRGSPGQVAFEQYW